MNPLFHSQETIAGKVTWFPCHYHEFQYSGFMELVSSTFSFRFVLNHIKGRKWSTMVLKLSFLVKLVCAVSVSYLGFVS